MPFCVGLTGGIGSGKSSAARMFEELGVVVVDTDAIAHELTRPGGVALDAIRSTFGEEYIASDGGLERPRMRRLVFSDAAARGKLEAILHPLIRDEARAHVADARAPYVVIVVPLLLETGAYCGLTNRVAIVDCSEEAQLERTMERSGLAAAEVRAIMATQLPRARRLAAADDVLHNDGDLAALRQEVQVLHRRYLSLAHAARSADGAT
ncbi:MAG: dephospho-CoA kinase [Betaproteobacteria bacterium]|nr:dephospho-CoA kinase [Betaproteobacteria bacterium]